MLTDHIECPNCQHQLSDAIQAHVAEHQGPEIDRLIQLKLPQLQQAAETKARTALALEMGNKDNELAEWKQRAEHAEAQELALRTRERQVTEKEEALDLQLARARSDERQKAAEEHHLKLAEKDQQLSDAKRINEELQRKLQQGSQQLQGDVLELDLEDRLKREFPLDQIEPVPKGMAGADHIQKVVSPSGQICGTIIWETKRTKAFNEDWYAKFKDDQRRAKADIAVLLSETLPADCKNFSHINGVWVTSPHCAIPLAFALRLQLIEIERTKLASIGKDAKMELLYRYLSGPEFRLRVQHIAETLIDMQKDVDEERRVSDRRLNKRAKQLNGIIAGVSGMYGDFQGLLGGSLLSNIPALTDETDPDRSGPLVDGAIVDRPDREQPGV